MSPYRPAPPDLPPRPRQSLWPLVRAICAWSLFVSLAISAVDARTPWRDAYQVLLLVVGLLAQRLVQGHGYDNGAREQHDRWLKALGLDGPPPAPPLRRCEHEPPHLPEECPGLQRVVFEDGAAMKATIERLERESVGKPGAIHVQNAAGLVFRVEGRRVSVGMRPAEAWAEAQRVDTEERVEDLNAGRSGKE